MKKTTVALAFIVATPLIFTGCSSGTSHSEEPIVTKICDQPSQINADTKTVAILAEQGPQSADRYKDEFESAIAGSKQMEARLLVNAVGGSRSAASGLVDTVLKGDGVNPTERNQDLACKDKLIEEAQEELAGLPEQQKLDVFGALRRLQGELPESAKSANVLLLSSLYNTTQPADMSDPRVLEDASATIDQLDADGLLVNCKNWQVYAVGASFDGRQALANTIDARLENFWRTYMQRCGGKLVAWTPRLGTFPSASG